MSLRLSHGTNLTESMGTNYAMSMCIAFALRSGSSVNSLTCFRKFYYVRLSCSHLSFTGRGSIWDNIALGTPNASADQVEEAAKAANAHDFIVKLPSGYDTEVGGSGTGMYYVQQHQSMLSQD